MVKLFGSRNTRNYSLETWAQSSVVLRLTPTDSLLIHVSSGRTNDAAASLHHRHSFGGHVNNKGAGATNDENIVAGHHRHARDPDRHHRGGSGPGRSL
jgi:hypothetical protein